MVETAGEVAEEGDALGVAGDGQGGPGLLDELAGGGFEVVGAADGKLGGDLGLAEVGGQHGGAGVASVVAAVRIDDDGRPALAGAVQGGGDDLGVEDPFAVVFEDHGVGLGGGGAGGGGEAVEDGPAGRGAAFAIDAEELLVVGDEAGLLGRAAGRVGDQRVGEAGSGGEQVAKLVGRAIGTDEADHAHGGSQLGGLHGDVGGAAGHLVLVVHLQDLDRRLGAEAVGAALDVAVEHHVADDRDPARSQGADQTL